MEPSMSEPLKIPSEAELDEWTEQTNYGNRLQLRKAERLLASLRLLLAEHRAVSTMHSAPENIREAHAAVERALTETRAQK